jgi:hypothetical protein
MLTDRIVGRVGADILQAPIRPRQSRRTDFPILRRSSGSTSSPRARSPRWYEAILANPDLARGSIDAFPEPWLKVEGLLPENVILPLNAGYVRNAGTAKEAICSLPMATNTTSPTRWAMSPRSGLRSSGPIEDAGSRRLAM